MPSLIALVVEDEAEKSAKILEALVSGGFALDDITLASNVRDAMVELTKIKFDLLVLDIALPQRAGDRVNPQGGISLLREVIEREEKFNLPTSVVGLTQYDELFSQAQEQFAARYWILDKYRDGEVGWRNRLAALASYLVSRNSSAVKVEYGVDVAFLTALDKELDAVRQLPWNWGAAESLDSATFQYHGHFTSDHEKMEVIAACAPRPGMVSAAVLAHKLIVAHRPRILVMTGITGGMEDECDIGDALLVDPSWDWQSGKHDGGTFLLAPDQIPISLDVRQKFALLSKDKISISDIHKEFVGHKPNAVPNILIGPVACGSSVLADKKKMSAIIKQNRKVLGVEMETYGVYSAVRDSGSPRPLVFGLKSVSDFGDGTKNDLFQPFASYFSARVSASFLERFCREIKQQLG